MSVLFFIRMLFIAATVCCLGCKNTVAPSVQRIPDIDGLSEAQLVAKYGPVSRVEEYRIGEALDEFRVGLQKYYPMPQSADVRVRELTWDFPDYHVTAWLHRTNEQWLVFDSLRYDREVQF